MGACARVALFRSERSRIRAPLGRALNRACGIAETRLGAEIGARRHERLRRAIDAGPSVLCHVEGSQSKRIRNAQNIALRSTARDGIYRGGAARGPKTTQAPGERS